MKKLIVAGLALSLAACSTVNPYTGEQQTSKAAKGGAIGAVAGAVVGAATSSKKDRKKGLLTGALVGGAIGAGTGAYMDQQEAILRQKLESTGVRVQREGDNLRLIMPGNITFASGQASIQSGFYETLNSIVTVLGEFKDTSIRIGGHTDSTGKAETNQILSEQRAAAVGQYLVAQGIAVGRVQTAGYGARYPVAPNTSEAGKQANRRVELELLPLK